MKYIHIACLAGLVAATSCAHFSAPPDERVTLELDDIDAYDAIRLSVHIGRLPPLWDDSLSYEALKGTRITGTFTGKTKEEALREAFLSVGYDVDFVTVKYRRIRKTDQNANKSMNGTSL